MEILNNGLILGMSVMGKRFKANEMYISEVLIAARAMYTAMDVTKPLFSESDTYTKGKIIIGTVQ